MSADAIAEDTLVIKNDELSGLGSRVFDYVVETLANQPGVATAYNRFAEAAAERIDEKQLSAYLSSNNL